MARVFSVDWAETGKSDLRGIACYIAQDNLVAALGFLDSIESRALDLSHFPERGRIVPELQVWGIWVYRELIVALWRIIYEISGDNVSNFWTKSARSRCT
jgi:plasmid stabilization system protein ParE